MGILPIEGSSDPAEALSWLDATESNFYYLHLRAQEILDCAMFMLRGPAKHWWKTMKGRYGDDTLIRWKSFEKDFRDKYVSNSHVEDRMREILDLIQ